MNRPVFPGVAQVRQLPHHLNMIVPADWEDRNGHVNVQYYLTLYELGGYEVLEEVALGGDYLEKNHLGLFDLEHHLSFRAEIRVGDSVSTYNRLLAMNRKRFHGMYFIVNDAREQLACTIEYITAGVDLRSRRTTAFPDEFHAGLQQQLKRHQALDWPAPVCNAISI